ncbi:MAG: GGDEF domain-containing protein [Lachnospiraceae bacterium]|nr:GGDEF domain-containing protein [Lachnospiraceae bacterium]
MAEIKNYLKPKYIAASVISILVGCAMLLANNLAERDRLQTSDFSQGWILEDGTEVDADDLKTEDFGGELSIRKKLPDTIEHGDALCFIASNIQLDISVDGECIYTYEQKKNLTGNGYGISYHSVSLCHAYEGKEVKIDMDCVYTDDVGGSIRMISLEDSRTYFSRIAKGQLIAYNISAGVVMIGLLLMLLRFIMPNANDQPRILVLGMTAVICGMWLANDTGFFRLFLNAVRVSRVADYVLMHSVFLPLSIFAYSITKERKGRYLATAYILAITDISFFLINRYALGQDMAYLAHYYALYILCSFALIAVMLIKDHIYCKKRGIENDRRFFVVGQVTMFICLVIDGVIYFAGVQNVSGHGLFSRVGICMFFLMVAVETVRSWLHEQASINRDRFINKLLQHSVSAGDPDASIRAIIEQTGKEYLGDHVYLFEKSNDRNYHLTYEWFSHDAASRVGYDYSDIPYEGFVDGLYDEFLKAHRMIVDNSEKTRTISPPLYELMKTLRLKYMVLGPIENEGRLTGFIGMDNVPEEKQGEAAEIIWLLSYFITQLLLQRDEKRNLEHFSLYDSLTGVHNRHALDVFEQDNEDIFPYGYIMCDINGLKKTNDTQGHDEGDELIKDVARCLVEVFGNERVFRIGGDEFIIYSFAVTAESFNAQVDRIKMLLYKKKRSVSMGCVFARDDSMSHREVKEKAEKLMYEDKDEYYSGGNDRRR